ncbi:MAG: helix-turn-helix transcriptional regulator [Fimbriimonadaceae bacterium]|nr:helix-turn-helix transcriptional regulator [Alphaproteobacteria bacterium]
MLTHKQIWLAIENLAARHDMTVSGLARRAGLDPTAFNKSKRVTVGGKERWPSTESISKILAATNASLDDFLGLAQQTAGQRGGMARGVPLIGLAEAGTGGFFDDGGFPVGGSWDEVHISGMDDENLYALKISGDSMLPLYRDGDIIIVSPNEPARRGDRVVVKTTSGEVMAKILYRQSERAIELHSLNPEHENRTFEMSDISWVARILWASQ